MITFSFADTKQYRCIWWISLILQYVTPIRIIDKSSISTNNFAFRKDGTFHTERQRVVHEEWPTD